jgi:hypothetical protein
MLPNSTTPGATDCGRAHPSARVPSSAAAACPFAVFQARSSTPQLRR